MFPMMTTGDLTSQTAFGLLFLLLAVAVWRPERLLRPRPAWLGFIAAAAVVVLPLTAQVFQVGVFSGANGVPMGRGRLESAYAPWPFFGGETGPASLQFLYLATRQLLVVVALAGAALALLPASTAPSRTTPRGGTGHP